ncbi:PREDICTED: uncharacterized protein LOC106118915 isoform X2 [Papilio xuthus]|uniref:Uncharacterized protein LOC106118915 isoform X2 n=1 Tax=Papilio xuthus TaxID=66420 RepID=A0AAJ7EAA1_PAPXU|nr:PREDICTED: uncharacterized protein LOC106118915 isoform X2 [Papilio xuthus]
MKGAYPVRSRTRFNVTGLKRNFAKSMKLWDTIKCYVNDCLTIMIDNYTVTMIVVLMLLSLFIPFVAKAIHDSSETKALRKIVNAITREVAQAQTDYEEVVGEYSLFQHSMHDVETTTKNSLHYCESCQRMLKSQGVQSDAKKNILQRLLRSIKCIPEPKLPRLEYKKKN